MKHYLLAVLCCAALAGCKDKEPTACHSVDCPHVQKPVASAHQHSSTNSHVKPTASSHQHSATCSHSNSAAGTSKKSFYDRTEAELEPTVRSAENGDLKAAYMLSRYYTRKQDSQKAEQWIAKTRELAAQASTNEPASSKIVQMLDRLEQNPASQTNAHSINFAAPKKSKAPRLEP
jgi:hypothetical protein